MSFLSLKRRALKPGEETALQRFIMTGDVTATAPGPTDPTDPTKPPSGDPRKPGRIVDWSAVAGGGPGLVLVTIRTLPSAGDAVTEGDGLGVLSGIFISINGVVSRFGTAAPVDTEELLSLTPGASVSLAVFARSQLGDGPISETLTITTPAPGVDDHAEDELILENGAGWFQLEDGVSEFILENSVQVFNADTYMARLSAVPAANYQNAIRAFFGMMAEEAIPISRFDVILLEQGSGTADCLVNAASLSITAAQVGTLGFTAGLGISGAGGGTPAYVALSAQPGAFTRCTQDAGSVVVYVEQEESGSSAVLVGQEATGTGRISLNPRNGAGQIVGRINGAADVTSAATVADRVGLTAQTRNGTSVTLWRGANAIHTAAQDSALATDQASAVTLFKQGSTFATDKVRLLMIGGPLSAAEIGVIDRAMQAYRGHVAPATIISAGTLSGTGVDGTTLTVTGESYSGISLTIERQWLRDGDEIPGATGTSYLLTSADVGAEISRRLSVSNSVSRATGATNAITCTAAPAAVEFVAADFSPADFQTT